MHNQLIRVYDWCQINKLVPKVFRICALAWLNNVQIPWCPVFEIQIQLDLRYVPQTKPKLGEKVKVMNSILT